MIGIVAWLPSEAAAGSVQAGTSCSGKVKATSSEGVKNTDKRKRVLVTCPLVRSADANRDGGIIRFTFHRSTKTDKKGSCTATSYDNFGNQLQSAARSVEPDDANFMASVTLDTSDGTVWGGYYVLECMLPPKWTLQSVEVEEDG